MTIKPVKRLIREGALAAEVDIELIEEEGGWTPYLSVDDAYKLDDVREALRAGDVKRVARPACNAHLPADLGQCR